MTTVLITGCSSGFGLEAALAFARRGDTVVATMRNLAKADTLQRRVEAEGLTVELEELDVTDVGSISRACTAVTGRHGAVDVLVNNAGVGYAGPVETISIDRARALMETNFWGAMNTAREVLPRMREQRSGTIINVTSLQGLIPGTIYSGMYSASKHALNALSEALAAELDPYGIRVVCIEPGFFATEIAANGTVDQEAPHPAYANDQEWLRKFMEGGVNSGADPAIVADVIVAAANNPETPLHVPVGDDADMYLALLDSVDGYEGWMEAVVPVVEGAVGPRPSLD